MAQDVDPTLCTNLNSPGECCGASFDHKATPGLCAACYVATTDSARALERKDWPQCEGCSAQLKLLKGSRCGSCIRKFARTLQKGSHKSSGGTLSAPIGNAKGMARQITVYLVPATSNTRTDASRMLGNATRAFPEDTPMEGEFNEHYSALDL
ncbi:hypothetical protein R3P38DRAFT_3188934 [Favolaschia claudopus]|uniref:Uncharacterized protein n=1 Tax=Favolaschia claudopus TaxID=2862362 RepID=A0AAW0BU39_9AGAR